MAAPAAADGNIHALFIPFLARGHTIPMVHVARLFAQRGVRCTVVTTPGNSSYIRDTIERARTSDGLPIGLELVPFPAAEVGLPAGIECTDALPAGGDEGYSYDNLYQGMVLLRHPVEKLVAERRPDCIVSDMLMAWTTNVAASHNVPLFLFSVLSPFSHAVLENVFTSGALLAASPGSDTVGPLRGLPHPLELTRPEFPNKLPVPGMGEKMREAESSACGLMFNCSEELMPEYVEHCRKVTLTGSPIEVWCVGPVQLHKSGHDDAWGGDSTMAIKNWLDSKRPESVLYVSFGSECFFSSGQLREIAAGLKGCKHSFIWVVRRGGGGAETMDEWLPEGFREAVGERGLILTEWAPQVAILNHQATGGCIMHCGWNSCIETVCAGLPAIAWPLHSDHFVSERLVVEVLRFGVRILEGPGMRSVDPAGQGIVNGEAIRAAVDRLMCDMDTETRAMRENATKYKVLSRSAMAEGGSSYLNLSRVIGLMNSLVKEKKT